MVKQTDEEKRRRGTKPDDNKITFIAGLHGVQHMAQLSDTLHSQLPYKAMLSFPYCYH